MTEIWLIKEKGGSLIPRTNEDADSIKKMPHLQEIKATTATHRDRIHHNRMMSLFRFYWDNFEPPVTEFKGIKVSMSYDRFRADIMRIMGYYTPVTAWNGDLRLEPDSLAFDKCSEEKARQIYSDLLDFGASKIFTEDMSREKVQELSEEWLRYN